MSFVDRSTLHELLGRPFPLPKGSAVPAHVSGALGERFWFYPEISCLVFSDKMAVFCRLIQLGLRVTSLNCVHWYATR